MHHLQQLVDESEKLNVLLNKYFNTYLILETIEKTCKNPVMDLSAVLKVL